MPVLCPNFSGGHDGSDALTHFGSGHSLSTERLLGEPLNDRPADGHEVAGADLTTGDRRRVVAALDQADKPSRPTMSADARRECCKRLAEITEAHPRQVAALQAQHDAHAKRAEDERRAALKVASDIEDLNRAYRADRDLLWAELRETRDPGIGFFVAEMRELEAELPSLQRVVGFHVRPASGALDYTQRSISNQSSCVARREAIQTAIRNAEKLTLEALDGDVLAGRLAALRAAVPPVEDVNKLAEAARRREQAAIDAT